jgi:hypothetical protein
VTFESSTKPEILCFQEVERGPSQPSDLLKVDFLRGSRTLIFRKRKCEPGVTATAQGKHFRSHSIEAGTPLRRDQHLRPTRKNWKIATPDGGLK